MKDFTDSLIEAYWPARKSLKEESEASAARDRNRWIANNLADFIKQKIDPSIASKITRGRRAYRLYVYNDAHPYYESEGEHKNEPAVEGDSSTSVYSDYRSALEALIDGILSSGDKGDESFMAYLAYPGIEYPFNDNKDFGGGIVLYSPTGTKIEEYRILADYPDGWVQGPLSFEVETVTPRKSGGAGK